VSAGLSIAMVASEAAPFAKTGGLADVVSALSATLHERGHDVRVFLPLYASTQGQGRGFQPVEFLTDIPIDMGRFRLSFTVYSATLPDHDLAFYFVHCPALYGRQGLYSDAWDEPIRFAFLCRAAIESCQRMGWGPDVFHCHDWHAALVPLYLQTVYGWDELFHRSRTVLTIHNLGYQGVFSADALEPLALAPHAARFFQEDLQAGRINLLKAGLLYAHALTTVSRTYAREIQTPEQGRGLDEILRRRSERLVGIVNGIDTDEWNPATDPHLPHSYSADDLEGKTWNKKSLLEELGLPTTDLETPLLGMVSRLTAQKGHDLLFDTLPPLLGRGRARFVALGSGDRRYADFLRWLAGAFPGHAAFREGYSEALAHRIEAGTDAFLMPSRYEPCGLNQMYSLRYGSVPIVRQTGGLADTVEPYDPERGEGTGFVFEHFNPAGLGWALDFALRTYSDRDAWAGLVRRGMSRDFSWERQTGVYEELYRRVVEL
jgi:starch synthase